MKKIAYSIAIIVTLGISSSSYAQKLMLGLRGGMDIASVAWDSAAPYGIKKGTINGLIGGAQLDVWFSDMFALSTGLLLDQKGWSEVSDYPNTSSASSNFTLNYLEIPLFLKVAFTTGSFQPYVFAGPSIGYMFWGYAKQNGTLGTDYKINDLLNTLDFSIVGGAGVAYNLPSGTQIFVDAGYAYGLVNILNENNQNYEDQLGSGVGSLSPVGAFKTRDIRIAGGFMFPI